MRTPILCGVFVLVLVGSASLLLAAKPQKDATTQKTDAQLLATVHAPAEFRVTLFARPPEVAYPTCLATSPTGEVFVAVDENGSLGKNPQRRQQVMRCLDKDGDGVADEINVFADRVGDIRGMFYDHGTLWVLHPPLLRAFHDDNSDGVADRNEVLVEGLGSPALQQRGADHCTNGFRLAIDGWMYIAVGDFGCIAAKDRNGKTLQLQGGGILRVRPDGTEMELFAQGTRNIFDVSVDPYLNVFTRDNTNDGGGWNSRLSHIIPTGNYGYPRLFKNFADEIVQPLADYGGGSATGSMFFDDGSVPRPWGSALLTCDWGRSEVYMHPLERTGAGFKAKQESFVKMPQPTDIDADGRGQLFISSWHNGSFDFKGPNVGFVARVSPPGAEKLPAPPDLGKAPAEVLMERLASSSQFWRLYAQREILRRADAASFAPALEKMAGGKQPLAARVAAIFTLKQLQGAKSNAALVALAKDDEVREFALRALADRKSQTAEVPHEPFVAALGDSNPRVRLAAIVGLGRLGAGEAAAKIVLLTADTDPLVAHAAVTCLVDLNAAEACLAAVDSATPVVAVGAARALQRMHTPAAVDGLIARLDRATDSGVRLAVVRALCRLYYREAEWKGDWWSTRPDTRGPYYRPVTWEQSAKIETALQHAASSGRPEMLAALTAEVGRHRVELRGTQVASSEANQLTELLSAPHPARGKAKILAAAAVADSNPPDLRARALAALCRAMEGEQPEPAVEALLAWSARGSAAPVLTAARVAFVSDPAHGSQLEYFQKLAKAKQSRRRDLAYAVMLNLANNPHASPEAAEEARKFVTQGWQNPAAAECLLRAAAELGAGDPEQIKSRLHDPNEAVRQIAQQAAVALGLDENGAAQPRIKGLQPAALAAAVAREKGDAAIGALLFVKQGCVSCHTVTPDQPPVGPFLGGISKRYTPADLLESVTRPSAKIAQGFQTQTFETSDGKQFAGFVVQERPDDIELRDTRGQAMRLRKKDIEDRGTSLISMMPEGLVVDLTPRQLASLIAYLVSLPDR